MPRTGARLQLHERRRVRGQPAGFVVEAELEHLVGAQMRHKDEMVRVVRADGMRVARRGNHLQRITDLPVSSDRIHADEIGAVRGAEEIVPGALDVDVRKALGERTGADQL